MPKKPTDYSKTIMYKIVCNDLNIKNCYVGHTTNWIKRKSLHKRVSNNENLKGYDSKFYQFIRENGGWGNWKMIEIKKYPCNGKREAEAEERRLFELLNSNLNTIRPFITEIEKKELYNKAGKKYYQKNKVEILDKQKIYYNDNKEQILDKNKIYIEKNKEKRREKFNCECGGKYTYTHKSRHIKTKRHQNFIKNMNS